MYVRDTTGPGFLPGSNTRARRTVFALIVIGPVYSVDAAFGVDRFVVYRICAVGDVVVSVTISDPANVWLGSENPGASVVVGNVTGFGCPGDGVVKNASSSSAASGLASPYDTSSLCCANGAGYSWSIVSPSERTIARYSPDFSSLKSACNSVLPGTGTFSVAKTIRYCPGPSVVPAGNAHWVRSAGSSVRYQPLKSAGASPRLLISIQSLNWPSRSASVRVFAAMNSEITTSAASIIRCSTDSITAFAVAG